MSVARGTPASIILLGSMYGQVASYPDAYAGICNASPVAYHTLNGGIIHMTRHLAAYWAADRVRVNCLSPGPFPSEMAPAAMVERRCEVCESSVRACSSAASCFSPESIRAISSARNSAIACLSSGSESSRSSCRVEFGSLILAYCRGGVCANGSLV